MIAFLGFPENIIFSQRYHRKLVMYENRCHDSVFKNVAKFSYSKLKSKLILLDSWKKMKLLEILYDFNSHLILSTDILKQQQTSSLNSFKRVFQLRFCLFYYLKNILQKPEIIFPESSLFQQWSTKYLDIICVSRCVLNRDFDLNEIQCARSSSSSYF